MRFTTAVLLILSLMLGIGIGLGVEFGLARQTGQGSPDSPDAGLSALMLRKGKESFDRARYGEAKEYFRRAILADPASPTGWSYYDLALIYTVAEQFKNYGKIVESTATVPETKAAPSPEPVPEPTPGMTAEPAPEATAAPAKAAPSAAPAKAPEVKSNPHQKAGEPAKGAPVAPEPAPSTQVSPAPVPAPAPTPPAPGGVESPKDEGC
ncbi:MAG: hypothetical protein AB1374_13065 [Bacillota bacterium]